MSEAASANMRAKVDGVYRSESRRVFVTSLSFDAKRRRRAAPPMSVA